MPSQHLRVQLLRTWLGAWLTARRTGAEHRPCIFQCRCGKLDELQHYMRCPALWRPIVELFHGFQIGP
eukprot:368743-Karenia_brevis.AAC.1